mgnify:CR=1 FL=1
MWNNVKKVQTGENGEKGGKGEKGEMVKWVKRVQVLKWPTPVEGQVFDGLFDEKTTGTFFYC